MESVWSVSKVSTESVGSRRELVANCVHTADADATKQFLATKLDSFVESASAVCIGLYLFRNMTMMSTVQNKQLTNETARH